MGEKVRIDDKWRIVIPVKFRDGLKPRDEVIVEKRGGEIIIRKASKEELLKKFRSIKLFISDEARTLNAESGKHRYGGVKE